MVVAAWDDLPDDLKGRILDSRLTTRPTLKQRVRDHVDVYANEIDPGTAVYRRFTSPFPHHARQIRKKPPRNERRVAATNDNGVWGYPFNRSYHMFSAWRILALASTTRARLATSLVSNRCGLPGLPRMAAVARRLRLSELRPRRRLALGRWPLHVSGVFDTQFGDGRYDLRSDADTLDDMVHRLLAVRHR